MKVQHAIHESASHNEIVTIDFSEGAFEALSKIAEDWTDDGRGGFEFWGGVPHADEPWRVHLRPKCNQE